MAGTGPTKPNTGVKEYLPLDCTVSMPRVFPLTGSNTATGVWPGSSILEERPMLKPVTALPAALALSSVLPLTGWFMSVVGASGWSLKRALPPAAGPKDCELSSAQKSNPSRQYVHGLGSPFVEAVPAMPRAGGHTHMHTQY